MSRSSGIATKALFRHAAKHARLERYIKQGERRAMQRSTKASVDGKAREMKRTFNLGGTKYRGINRIKQSFRTRLFDAGRDLQAVEKAKGDTGIPLRDYGAKETKKGLTFRIYKGRKLRLLRGFLVDSVGGHAFTRKGRSRLPIRKRFGPGLATLADQDSIRLEGARRFQERIDDELRKEERRAQSRAGL